MKRTLLIISVLVALSAPAAACDYGANGDSECSPGDNNYCINYVCQIYAGDTTLFCDDSDGDDPWVFGTVTYRYRESYSGWFSTGSMSDDCLVGWAVVDSCGPGPDCGVGEWVCEPAGDLPHSSNPHECTDGCSSGACDDLTEPDSTVTTAGDFSQHTFPGQISGTASDEGRGVEKVEMTVQRDEDGMYWNGGGWSAAGTWLLADGTEDWSYPFGESGLSDGSYSITSRAIDRLGNVETTFGYNYFWFWRDTVVGDACDYEENGDEECDSENGVYCIEGICTMLNEPPEIACIDTDDMNEFTMARVTYSYRMSNGSIVAGTEEDVCVGYSVLEYFCLSPLPASGLTYGAESIACENGCSEGACEPGDVPEPPGSQAETCGDGVKNCHTECMETGNPEECCETGVDCGGPCPVCEQEPPEPAETCGDMVNNCHSECLETGTAEECCETDVDCGGPCPVCEQEPPEPAETCGDMVNNCHSGCLETGTKAECCETDVDCGGPCEACEPQGPGSVPGEDGNATATDENVGNGQLPGITGIIGALMSLVQLLGGDALVEAPLELLLLAILSSVAAVLIYNRLEIFMPKETVTTRKKQMLTALRIGAALVLFFLPFAVNRMVDVRIGIVVAVVEVVAVLLAHYAKKGSMEKKAISVARPK